MSQSRAEKLKKLKKKKRLAKRRRIKRIRNYSIATIGIAVAAVAFYFLFGAGRYQPGTFVPSLGNNHIQSIDSPHIAYNSIPPTSGPHISGIARWGIHLTPIPDELQVHNLEDGGVLVQYNPDLDDQSISELKEIVGSYSEWVILAPYPDLDAPIVLTAWTRIAKIETVDRKRIARFIRSYRRLDHHDR